MLVGVLILEGESRSAEDAVLCRGLGGPQFSTQISLKDAEPLVNGF